MDRTGIISGVVVALCLLAGCSQAPQPIVVGSKTSTEQAILGEIVAQYLEKKVTNPVQRKLNMGGTLDLHQALAAGQIDVYPEYTGAATTIVLAVNAAPDADIAEERVRREYTSQQLVWLPRLGFDKRTLLAVRAEDAQAENLEKMSDAVAHKAGWALGASREFMDRSDGYATLMRSYDLPLDGAPRVTEMADLFSSIGKKQLNAIVVTSTDGYLGTQNLKLLSDDRHVFGPDRAALVTRMVTLQRVPGLDQVLTQLSGKISVEAMQRMNNEVDVKRQRVADVAKQFVAKL